MTRILAFDLETRKLASEVEAEHAAELKGESPWTRPDFFGFGVGVIVNVETGEAMRFGPGQAEAMIERLRDADRV